MKNLYVIRCFTKDHNGNTCVTFFQKAERNPESYTFGTDIKLAKKYKSKFIANFELNHYHLNGMVEPYVNL